MFLGGVVSLWLESCKPHRASFGQTHTPKHTHTHRNTHTICEYKSDGPFVLEPRSKGLRNGYHDCTCDYMWCEHAPILALPLGQCPFMDTARKVAGTPHSKRCLLPRRVITPIHANGGLSIRAGRCTGTGASPWAGLGARSKDQVRPKEPPRPLRQR